MNPQRVEILGPDRRPLAQVELIPVEGPAGAYKLVVQFLGGYQVTALRSEMAAGRISGILGKPPPPRTS